MAVENKEVVLKRAADCWSVQIKGLKACITCEFFNNNECGGAMSLWEKINEEYSCLSKLAYTFLTLFYSSYRVTPPELLPYLKDENNRKALEDLLLCDIVINQLEIAWHAYLLDTKIARGEFTEKDFGQWIETEDSFYDIYIRKVGDYYYQIVKVTTGAQLSDMGYDDIMEEQFDLYYVEYHVATQDMLNANKEQILKSIFGKENYKEKATVYSDAELTQFLNDYIVTFVKDTQLMKLEEVKAYLKTHFGINYITEVA